MKAIINGITIEGTPDEIRQVVNGQNNPTTATYERTPARVITPKNLRVWADVPYDIGTLFKNKCDSIGVPYAKKLGALIKAYVETNEAPIETIRAYSPRPAQTTLNTTIEGDRHYKKWSAQEDALLRGMVKKGEAIDMATLLLAFKTRSENGIRARICSLGIGDYSRPRHFSKSRTLTVEQKEKLTKKLAWLSSRAKEYQRKYNWTYRQGLVQAGRDAKMLANSPSMPKENGGGAV